MPSRALLPAFLLLAISCDAAAETAVPSELLTCSRIKKNSERLACYDEAVEYLRKPAGAAAPSAETSFGRITGATEASRNAAAERGSEPDDTLTSLTARIAAVSADAGGMSIVVLDNAQTWRQLTGSTHVVLTVGDEVTITRASLGSFLMSVPIGRPLRVRRVQ